MDIIIQKYGGTSLSNIDSINRISAFIADTYNNGSKQLVVVVSAMGQETDSLLKLANNFASGKQDREIDAILALGEQKSAALLALAIKQKGIPALSLTGWQAGIVTTNTNNNHNISRIHTQEITKHLGKKNIVIVAGFQGVDDDSNVTTLSRGGSDTTAVALAVALKAKKCEIYTDVEGILTANPKFIKEAKLLPSIDYSEALELSSMGAEVVHPAAIELAAKFNIPICVKSSFNSHSPGTKVANLSSETSNKTVTGITFVRNYVYVKITNLPIIPELICNILDKLRSFGISVDMILQSPPVDGKFDFCFAINKCDIKKVQSLLLSGFQGLTWQQITITDRLARVALVGLGLKNNTAVISRIFQVLSEEGLDIVALTTTEIKVALLLPEKYLEAAILALHQEFCLSQQAIDENLMDT